jgi:single-strand DNA-binding protein
MNKLCLIGRFTRTIEMKQLQSGTNVLTNCLAVDRIGKSKNGVKETDYFEITAFGKQAEILNMFALKGSKAYLEGSFENHKYQTQKGENRDGWQLIVSYIELLDKKIDDENTKRPQENTPAKAPEPLRKDFDATIVSDDDLPF